VKNSVIFLGVLVLGITALLIGGKRFLRPQGSANAAVQGSASGPEKGTIAPDFTLKVLDSEGKNMQLSSLKGKAVLLNFWATWCEPCKLEMPWLVELQKKYGPQGLQIVGVAMDDAGEKSISDFSHKMGVNYPVLLGTEKVADLYGGLDGLPTTFFLDRNGKIVDRALGLESESLIEDSIKKSLGEGAASTASAQ